MENTASIEMEVNSLNEADLKNRNSRDVHNMVYILIGKVFTTFGVSIYSFAVSLFVLKETGSGTSFAISILCSSVPKIILSPISGVIADRVNKKKMMIGFEVLSGFIMLMTFGAVITTDLSIYIVYASQVFMAISSTFFNSALNASIPIIVHKDKLQKLSSLNQSISSTSSILGPVIGGVVYAMISLQYFMLFNVMAFFISAFFQTFIVFDAVKKEDSNTGKKEKESFWEEMKTGFTYVKSNKMIYSLINVCTWLNFLFTGLTVSLSFIIVTVLKLSSTKLGIIEAMLASGMLVMSLILSTRKEIEKKYFAIKYGLYVVSVAVFLVAFPMLFDFSKLVSFGFLAMDMFVIGFFIVLVNVPIQVLMQSTVPKEYIGRVFGILDTFATGITPIGIILFGFLLDVIKAQYLPMISGVLLCLVVAIGLKKKTFIHL